MKLFDTINKFFGAYCDPDNGKIYGCEPDTLAWFHEERHIWQAKKFHGVLSSASLLLQLGAITAFSAWFFCVVGTPKITPPTWLPALLAPSIALLLLIEVDAWIYSTYVWVKRRLNKNSD